MKRFIFSIIFCLATVLSVFSQVQEITNADYWRQYHAAVEMPFETSKRITSKEEYYENGKLGSTTESVDEFLKPDKRRFIETYKSRKSARKDEAIQIGETHYCRENGGAWKKSDGWCIGGIISALPKPTSSRFSVEETKINNQTVRLYQQYITYKNEYSPNKDKEGLSYFQDKFWANSDGFILRREIESGLIEPKRIYNKEVTIYEYNLKDIKIEVPILSKKRK
jgi:hypothetical protein